MKLISRTRTDELELGTYKIINVKTKTRTTISQSKICDNYFCTINNELEFTENKFDYDSIPIFEGQNIFSIDSPNNVYNFVVELIDYKSALIIVADPTKQESEDLICFKKDKSESGIIQPLIISVKDDVLDSDFEVKEDNYVIDVKTINYKNNKIDNIILKVNR